MLYPNRGTKNEAVSTRKIETAYIGVETRNAAGSAWLSDIPKLRADCATPPERFRREPPSRFHRDKYVREQ